MLGTLENVQSQKMGVKKYDLDLEKGVYNVRNFIIDKKGKHWLFKCNRPLILCHNQKLKIYFIYIAFAYFDK